MSMAWRRVLPALATAGAGSALLVEAATEPFQRGPISMPVPPLEDMLSAVGGAILLLLGWALWRGTRRAAVAAATVLLAAAAVAFLRNGFSIRAGAEVGLACLLVANRRAFPRGGGRPVGSWRLWGLLLGGGLLAAYAIAVAELGAKPAVGFRAAVAHAGSWLVHGHWWMRSDAPPAVVLDLLAIVLLAALAALMRTLLRPAEGTDGHTPAMHRRATRLLAAHGQDSLDPFTLREDKALYFDAGGFLAYRVLAGTAVVSGDPVGPPGTAPAVLASFERFAQERGWEVVITAASGRHLEGYRALGFAALQIGDEAVVDPQRFTLEGRAVRKVRQSVNRIERRGWSTEVVCASDLRPDVAAELAAVEREWRTRQPRLYGFAMTLGRLWGADEDVSGVYVLARDPSGVVRGFLRFAAYDTGLSLDVMRRPAEAPNGLNEALVCAALAHARERGAREVSLNFAGFAHIMAAGAALTRGQRLLRFLLERLHGRFQLERLVRFNQKFGPEWRPRYLVHRGRAVLPIAALRVLQAEAYIRPPAQRPLERRWEPRPEPVLREPVLR